MKPLLEGNIPIEHFHDADMIVVGDPERCFEKMKHYADLGVDQLICYVQFGYHSDESVMKTIELLGKEVLPELEVHRGEVVSEVRYTRVGDDHVAYRIVEGAGRLGHTIVMMGGGTASMESYADDPVAARLVEGLASIGRLVMLDRRGVGLSDPLPPESRISARSGPTISPR